MRTWVLVDTGLKRIPIEGDWYAWGLYGTPVKCGGEKLYNEYPILSLTVYGSDPLEGIKENLESITCLAAEGPEVTPHAKLFEAILREALKALNILGR